MKIQTTLIVLVSLMLTTTVTGQGLDPRTLLELPTDAWPTYNGDYSGRRYSPLDEINSDGCADADTVAVV